MFRRDNSSKQMPTARSASSGQARESTGSGGRVGYAANAHRRPTPGILNVPRASESSSISLSKRQQTPCQRAEIAITPTTRLAQPEKM